MHPACMHVNTCTYIPQHTSIQLNRCTQKYINLWLWPKRPPLAFYMAEMSVAEMSWPKCSWPKRPWPKYPTFNRITHFINHKILVTNKFLYQIKMIDSPDCSFCGNNEELIEHLFWKCSNTQQFVKKMTEKFQEMSISLNLNERNFILGYFPQNTSNIIQFLMLVAKYYINMCKGTNKRLTFLEYKINVQSLFQSHKEIALQNNKMQNFLEAWAPFKNLFNIN